MILARSRAPRLLLLLLPLFSLFVAFSAQAGANANRFTYLDDCSPFYPGLHAPKLTTPQWIGEPGVEAVVIVSIDDMYASEKFENYLRPILERLKKIDGRAPVSIFSNGPNPQDPQLQTWLKEGLSFEIHTLHHPCPLLAQGNFQGAQNTFHGCVDLLNHVSGNKPVAFRMPCCDSMNSPSPRFYFEILNRTNSAGHFLTIDSSIMNITTTNDPTLPKTLTVDADGKERFRKYVPFPSFVTTIEDYPYPYQIGDSIWEIPCAVPSDWEAQNLHGTNNVKTVADWKAGLDAAVIKQGVFTLLIHPHGWIKAEQVIEFIDYAQEKYGRKVKFLNFRETQERLDIHLLLNQPMRVGAGDNGVRILDLNNDGFMDVVIANGQVRKTRLWQPTETRWADSDFPFPFVAIDSSGKRHEVHAQFGVLRPDGFASVLVRAVAGEKTIAGAWNFDGANWVADDALLKGLEAGGSPVYTAQNGDRGVRFRDVDNDGQCELIVANSSQNAIFHWSPAKKWEQLPYNLPAGTALVGDTGRDNGLRFVDVNEDGFADVLFSNPERFSLHLFVPQATLGFERGWTMQVRGGKRGDPNEIPMISRGGEFPNNGAWFRNRHLWVQNEDTATKPDVVDRRSFAELLALDAPPPKSPEESLASMKPRPGFKVELVAAEPFITDPIAFEWGADGKLWVVEMGDYPLGTDGKGKGGGKVRFLEDTDADGKYDKSTIFLEDLDFPTGVIPWRNGVIISAAPDIFYAEDSNGDGKADVRETLFTGFHPGNQQHRVNGFDYGLDNWIYGANGDSGGEITSVKTGKKVNINGRDFRFRPHTGELQSESGQTQFGRRRDDWGNWFGNNNPTWLWHYVYPERYLSRNPHLPVRETKHWLANYPENTRVFPASRTLERFNWAGAANHVTSACSPSPYRDDLFGPEFTTSVFVSEPVHNCIHREVLQADGVTFTSRRAADEATIEFLSSTDNWFRPAMTRTGPDGALYVADMYRLVIEHPEWIPAERQKRIDLRAGSDKGRIYRIYPETARLRPIPNLAKMNTTELVAAIDSSNGWQRDTAQRLLVERHDKSAIEPLKKVLFESRDPRSRMQALCAIEGLGGVTPQLMSAALKDPHAGVRVQGIRMSEQILRAGLLRVPLSALEEFRAALLQLAEDTNDPVRFQLAFTLGEWRHARAGQALARMTMKDWDNPHIQVAIMSSSAVHVGEMLANIMAQTNPPPAAVEQLLTLATVMQDQAVYQKVLGTVSDPAVPFEAWRYNALAGFLDALERRGQSLAGLEANATPLFKEVLGDVQRMFLRARKITSPEHVATNALPNVLASLRILGRGTNQVEEDIVRLGTFCDPKHPIEIQKTALNSLSKIKSRGVAETLLSHWRTMGPETKAEAIQVLFGRIEWLHLLIDAMERGDIAPGQIGAAPQQQLQTHSDEKIRARAAKLFVANPDRQKVLQQYESVATLKADPARGQTLFSANCAPCHRFRDEGIAIGPDLGMLNDKPVSVWLTAILDPNQAIEARYISYTAVTQSDREISGVIVTETGNSVTMKTPTGAEETLLRTEIKELKSSGLSLMPEGLENALKPQDVADLIGYLRAR